MFRRLSFCVLLAFTLALPLVLSSCGGDDGEPDLDGETTPPVVLLSEPGNGESTVPLDEEILVVFSEDMDPATAAGNVLLSPGENVGLAWLSADSLLISHDAWSEAVEVTLTLTVGLKDLAGTSLALPYTCQFWTYSSLPRLLGSEPPDGATDVPVNITVLLQFSHEMDPASLASAIVMVPPVTSFVVSDEDDFADRVTFTGGPLASSTAYLLIVTTAAQTLEMVPRALAEAETISFTTGTTADTTPPYIVSTVPARNATGVASSVAQAVFTFSEPIDPDAFRPDRVGAQTMAWMAAQPQWSAGNTVLTVQFRTPLPAGVRLFACLGAGSFSDLVGNFNTAADSLSFTVAGSPDYVPVAEGAWFMFSRRWESTGDAAKWASEDTVWVAHQNALPDGTFDRVTANDAGFSDLDEVMHMQITAPALLLRGFTNPDAGDQWVTPAATYLPLPVALGDWSGTSTIDGADLAYDGHVLLRELLTFRPEESSPLLVLENCWRVVLNHTIIVDDATMETGADTLWYAPAVGIARRHSKSWEDPEGERPVIYWSQNALLAFDPFGD